MLENKAKEVRLNSQDMTLGGLLARGIPGGSNMTDCLNVELLAEFIDGKLSSENRERVVAHLGDCTYCYSVVSESLGIREELSKQGRSRNKKYLSYSLPSALAVAAVLLLVFKILQPGQEFTRNPERESARREASVEIKSLPKPDITLSTRSFAGQLADRLAGHNTTASLTRVAGNQFKRDTTYGFSSVVTLEKAAFGIGECLIDLELALKAKDRKKIDVFAKKLIDLLKPIESSYGLIPAIVEQRGTSGTARKEEKGYEGFSRSVETLFANKKEAVFVKFGAWVEAASLAALVRDAAFFQTSVVRGFTMELEKSGVPVGTLKDLSQLELITSSGGIQKDQFNTMARLLADIKEMFCLPNE